MAMNPRIRGTRSQATRSGSGQRPSSSTDPRRARPRSVSSSTRRPQPAGPQPSAGFEAILDEFTRSWNRGERPRAEDFLGRLGPADSAELIYHEFCLAEAANLEPDPSAYFLRFPEQAEALDRLFSLHQAVSASMIRDWVESVELPQAGDEIGSYKLIRELGRGTYARVFLAEQADLDHRQVVVKVSTRATAEPRLLARARHPHIVEVLRHAVAEDGALHLVCMPFLGGATLASVLERRRASKRPARSGLHLLADLECVSAPEYPAPGRSRPARNVIAGLGYPGAMAWIVARLAEALDHAHARGVAHGDLKPSNVLLTAEASPMLLDFNLAIDRRGDDGLRSANASGGTLAYMAPEQLRAFARVEETESRADDGEGTEGQAIDLHRADLYGLGLILLESLTGSPPEVAREQGGDPRVLAGELARARGVLPQPLRSPGRSPIPPTLRSILAKCLAPDPANRYGRGLELAEDLDRWRTDRPLAFADESREQALARQVRRGRRVLAAVLLTLVATLAVGGVATTILRGTKRDQAQARWSAILGQGDPDIFSFRPLGAWKGPANDPVEIAVKQLARYGVEADPGWRNRDDVARLDDRERGELEAWLDEQILRLTIALGEREDSPGDWRRALDLLEREEARMPLAAFRAQARSLRAKLGLPEPGPIPTETPRPPRWLEAYLDGFAADRLHAREAKAHYLDALRDRPELFWAHYWAAGVAYRTGEYTEAAEHLRRCVDRAPDNASLHLMLANALFNQGRDSDRGRPDRSANEAILECALALALDPDLPEANYTRSLLFQASDREEDARIEVKRFALLTKAREPGAPLMHRARLLVDHGPNGAVDIPAIEALARKALEAGRDDRDAHATLAATLWMSGHHGDALSEYDRAIEAEPEHLRARYQRALLRRQIDVRGSTESFTELIEHPRFEELLREDPTAIRSYHYVANDLADRGRTEEAMEVARHGLALVNRSRLLQDEAIRAMERRKGQYVIAPRGETHYLMARILAPSARTEPDRFLQAASHLERAFQSHPSFRDVWFANDRKFDGLREAILERLGDGPISQ